MVTDATKRSKLSTYEVGEKVYIKEKKQQSGRLRRNRVQTGIIVEANRNTHFYKVRLDDGNREKWFKVENVAAFTRQDELDKRAHSTDQRTGQVYPDSSAYRIIEEFIRACNDRIVNSQHEENRIRNDLLTNMRNNGLQSVGQIPRDGNCMFHAVAQSLNAMDGSDYEQQDIREMVVSWLESNPFTSNGVHLSSFVYGFTWEDYLQGIARTEWGDHICLRAISNIFEVNIEIVSSQSPTTHRIIHDEETTRNVYLGHEFEFHYIRLEPIPAESRTPEITSHESRVNSPSPSINLTDMNNLRTSSPVSIQLGQESPLRFHTSSPTSTFHQTSSRQNSPVPNNQSSVCNTSNECRSPTHISSIDQSYNISPSRAEGTTPLSPSQESLVSSEALSDHDKSSSCISSQSNRSSTHITSIDQSYNISPSRAEGTTPLSPSQESLVSSEALSDHDKSSSCISSQSNRSSLHVSFLDQSYNISPSRAIGGTLLSPSNDSIVPLNNSRNDAYFDISSPESIVLSDEHSEPISDHLDPICSNLSTKSLHLNLQQSQKSNEESSSTPDLGSITHFVSTSSTIHASSNSSNHRSSIPNETPTCRALDFMYHLGLQTTSRPDPANNQPEVNQSARVARKRVTRAPKRFTPSAFTSVRQSARPIAVTQSQSFPFENLPCEIKFSIIIMLILNNFGMVPILRKVSRSFREILEACVHHMPRVYISDNLMVNLQGSPYYQKGTRLIFSVRKLSKIWGSTSGVLLRIKEILKPVTNRWFNAFIVIESEGLDAPGWYRIVDFYFNQN